MTTSAKERLYTRAEYAVDAVIHVVGVLFAINGGLWLLFHVTGLSVVASVSVYCAGLFAMLTVSALYNLWPHGNTREWLRRFDHAAIFIMIAATYTPFAVNRLQAPASGTILGLIWFGATVGVILKMLFPRRFEIASVTLYLGLGWLVVTVIKPLSVALATVDFRLLVAGGLVYSAGVVFYLSERIPYHKAIWHGFVLVAVILHFTAIASEFATALP
ncbi:MAG TPA: hemolysin III family protein [Rhizomicrobium sp.]|jgi:hemolysin III|nr:hemolysin III family protein [Rhizomicrobium sp.]